MDEQGSSIICAFQTVAEDQSAAGPDEAAIATCETVRLGLFWCSKEKVLDNRDSHLFLSSHTLPPEPSRLSVCSQADGMSSRMRDSPDPGLRNR